MATQHRLENEIYFGSCRGNIVGKRYYQGSVNNNEMVSLIREPHNPFDANALRVDNVHGVQVGHIKRELARPLADVVDFGLARLKGGEERRGEERERRGEERGGEGRRGEGEERRGVERRGEERRGEERRGEERRGEARRGEARRGEARRGEARRGEDKIR
ncbi:hypothetical protein ACROYT_G027482 [Oculina patagonica]